LETTADSALEFISKNGGKGSFKEKKIKSVSARRAIMYKTVSLSLEKHIMALIPIIITKNED
jgi:hypothetical protein